MAKLIFRDATPPQIHHFRSGTSLFGSRAFARGSIESSRFDLHHHFFPPVAKKRYGRYPPIQDYSPAKAVEEMDEAGVETAFLSLPTRLGDNPDAIRQEAIGFAREANEYAAGVASDYAGRFGFFAFLPLPDVDASLHEIEYALRYTWGRRGRSHGGGTLLGLIGRFLGKGSTRNVKFPTTAERDSKLHHLRRFYYDTALSANRIQMQALKDLVGPSQIVFGSDFPFMPIHETVDALNKCSFNAEELRGISRESALRILPARTTR